MLQLYKNIKKRRQQLNMTQSELAKKLGYADKSMIAKIEKGTIDLTQSKILAFADALETIPEELMGWEEKNNSPSRIWKNLKQLRKSKGVSTNELSKFSNIPLEQIEDFENNISIPNYDTLVTLSKVLDCEVSRLLLGDELDRYDMSIIDQIDDIMMGNNEARKKLIKSAIDLPEEDILFMEKVLDALIEKRPIDYRLKKDV